MVTLSLQGTRSICKHTNYILTIHYYLTTSYIGKQPVYGIQILSFETGIRTSVHSETIPHISYSLSYVKKLLQLCKTYQVTPTDAFSSLDALMDMLNI